MKRVLILSMAMVCALFLTFQSTPAKASANPIVSMVWSDPALGGWSFGTATRTLVITLDDYTQYETASNADRNKLAVGWYYTDDGQATLPDSLTQSGNTITASWNLTGTTVQAGAVGVNIFDATTHQLIETASGMGHGTDLSMFMAHNINVKGNQPAECVSADRADETTDLSAVTDFRALELTLMCAARGKIHFTTPMNFTSTQTMQALRSIFESLDADMGGEFGLSDSTIEMLRNAGAEVTMYGLPYTSTPDVKYNGTSGSGAASNVTFDAASRSVTFAANHFSTYSAVPKVTLTAPTADATVTSATYTVTGTVNDPAATVKVYVGTTDQGTITVDSTTGAFSKEVTLAEGANVIKVTSSNSIGSGFDVTKTLTYEKPATLASTGSSSRLGWALFATFVFGLLLVGYRRKIA